MGRQRQAAVVSDAGEASPMLGRWEGQAVGSSDRKVPGLLPPERPSWGFLLWLCGWGCSPMTTAWGLSDSSLQTALWNHGLHSQGLSFFLCEMRRMGFSPMCRNLLSTLPSCLRSALCPSALCKQPHLPSEALRRSCLALQSQRVCDLATP